MTMSRMARVLTVLLVGVLAAMPLVRAQSSYPAAVMLEAAIQTELVDGDLDKALELYTEILARYGNERPVAAEALLHIGQSYEKLGEPRAREAYQRLLREYADQSRVAAAARTGLAALAEAPTSVEASEVAVGEVRTRPPPTLSSIGYHGRYLIFSDLAVHNLRTGENRRLTSSARSAAYPVLSPDGQQVAYLSWSGDLEEKWRNANSGRAVTPRFSAELRIVALDGSGDRVLVTTEKVPWIQPFAWSPDAQQILTVFERGNGTNEIVLVSAADGATRVLKSLAWRPQEMSFSPDGRYVAYGLPTPRNSRRLDMSVLAIDGDRPLVERRYSLALAAEGAQTLTDDQQVIHILNRLGFGPRFGDIERVKAMGIEAYIEEQLDPERIPDPVVEETLAGFRLLRTNEEMTEEQYFNRETVPQVRRRLRVLDQRRLAEAREDETAEPVNMERFREMAATSNYAVANQMRMARLVRAVYSERQLQEMMVDFWMNHFNVNFGGGGGGVFVGPRAAAFEHNVIRPRTLGTFADLLVAVAKHPAMLRYLDNWRSSAPAEVIEERVAALKPTLEPREYVALRERMLFLEQARGLNENYARELMELHTLGIDGGYTQNDIIEVAKILTGWTTTVRVTADGDSAPGDEFRFDPLLHVDGNKVVLGQTIPSGGIEEGEQLLAMLAHHPSTARFISTKLARRFVADDPPAEVVEAASRTFQQTGGDIREVLRTIFTSPQFLSAGAYRAKIKKPLELVASSLRAVNAQLDVPPALEPGIRIVGTAMGLIVSVRRAGGLFPSTIEQMGERLYNYEAPDGNPDVGAAWMNSNALLVRLDLANALATSRLDGVRVDLRSARLLLEQLGLPQPTSEQIEQTRAMLQRSAGEPTRATQSMRGTGSMRAGARGAVPGGPTDVVTPEAIVVATMLGSPQFQKR